MSERRWIKFWPADWFGDKSLRTCSPAARGAWMDLICVAHDGSPYGHVTINEKPASTRQIAAIIGVGESVAVRLLAELEDAGVFSRAENGGIFSRRMVRDRAASLLGQAWVSTRYPNKEHDGNPNGDPTRGATGDPSSLEARSKKLEAKKEESSLRSPKKPPIDIRGSRLPSDWEPSEADIAYAVDLGLDAKRVAENFRGFWLAKAGANARKVDWPLTWQVWCRRDADQAPLRSAVKAAAPRQEYDPRYFEPHTPQQILALGEPRLGTAEYGSWSAARHGFWTKPPEGCVPRSAKAA